MTLDLRLAGAAQVGRRNDDVDERVVPEHDLMRANDFAVLEGKRVERLFELGLGKDERRGDVRPRAQRGDSVAHAFRSSAVRTGDERQARERRGVVAVDVRCRYATTERSRSPKTPRRSRRANPRRVLPANCTAIYGKTALRIQCRPVHLRELNVGCVGGGTGLPSLLGGLKTNPWLS